MTCYPKQSSLETKIASKQSGYQIEFRFDSASRDDVTRSNLLESHREIASKQWNFYIKFRFDSASRDDVNASRDDVHSSSNVLIVASVHTFC